MTTLAHPTTRCNIPDTVETVARTDDDILLWVEDAAPAPKQWDRHVGERPSVMAPAKPRELPEVDFMDAALADYRRNGNGHSVGLHEDPNDTRMDYREARRPTF